MSDKNKTRKSGPLISMHNSTGGTIENVDISDRQTGIEMHNSTGTIKKTRFRNVQNPIDAQNSEVRVSETQALGGTGTGHSSSRHRPSGPRIPCICPRCEWVFPSRTITAFNSKFYINQVTEVCPGCSFEEAELARGLWNLGVEVLDILFLEGPKTSFNVRKDFLETLEALAKAEEPPKDVTERLEQQSPGITARTKSVYRGSKELGSVLIIIFAGIGTTFDFFHDDLPLARDYLQQLFEQLIYRDDAEGRVPTLPTGDSEQEPIHTPTVEEPAPPRAPTDTGEEPGAK